MSNSNVLLTLLTFISLNMILFIGESNQGALGKAINKNNLNECKSGCVKISLRDITHFSANSSYKRAQISDKSFHFTINGQYLPIDRKSTSPEFPYQFPIPWSHFLSSYGDKTTIKISDTKEYYPREITISNQILRNMIIYNNEDTNKNFTVYLVPKKDFNQDDINTGLMKYEKNKMAKMKNLDDNDPPKFDAIIAFYEIYAETLNSKVKEDKPPQTKVSASAIYQYGIGLAKACVDKKYDDETCKNASMYLKYIKNNSARFKYLQIPIDIDGINKYWKLINN